MLPRTDTGTDFSVPVSPPAALMSHWCPESSLRQTIITYLYALAISVCSSSFLAGARLIRPALSRPWQLQLWRAHWAGRCDGVRSLSAAGGFGIAQARRDARMRVTFPCTAC